MKICPECGFQNRAGMMFCDDCACNIVLVKEASTKSAVETIEAMPVVRKVSENTTTKLEAPRPLHKSAVVLYIRGAQKPFIIPPGKSVLLGRDVPEDFQKPDIDLTPYRGVENGVSRRHAILDNSTGIPQIIDVGSSNGVHVNGTRLVRGKSQNLMTGDHVYLGRLAAYVQVKTVKVVAKKTAPQPA